MRIPPVLPVLTMGSGIRGSSLFHWLRRSGDGFNRLNRLIRRVSDHIGREFMLRQHLGRRRDCFPHANRKYVRHGIEGGYRSLGDGVASIGIGLKDVDVLALVLITLDRLAKSGGNVVARCPLLDLRHIRYNRDVYSRNKASIRLRERESGRQSCWDGSTSPACGLYLNFDDGRASS